MAKHITMPDGQKIETDYALRAKSAKSADDISSHHVQKGSSGSDSVYYKLAEFPVWNDAGNNSSVTVSGRIGGYGSSTIFSINGMFSNRDGYVGAGTIFGSKRPEAYLPRGNLEMWEEEDGTSSLWIKVTGYWVFDLNVTCSNGAKDVYSGQSAAPTGTLKWALCKESGMASDIVVGYGKSFLFLDWDGKTSNVTSATNDSQGNLIASQTWANSTFWPISNDAIFPTWQVGDAIALSEYKQDTGNVFGYKVANGDFHLVSGNVTTTLNPPLNKAKNISAGYADTDGQRAPYILFSVDGKDTKNAAIDYRVRYILPALPPVETSTTNSASLQSTNGYVYDNKNNKRFLLGTTTESNLAGIQGGKIRVTIPAGGAGTRSNRTSVTFPKAFQKADKVIVQLTVNGGYNSEDAGMSVYNGTIKTTGFDVIATWFNAVSATRAITIGWLAYEVK